MNLDIYMPFYGPNFLTATAGFSRGVKGSYLNCLLHYWFHEHCKGLKNNDEFLRRLCECDREEWDETRDALFTGTKFFVLGADELWHQKFADENWERSKAIYESKVAAGKKRWQNKSKNERSKHGKFAAAQRWKERNHDS
jgi:uncharacterized protein YdaU (DUF1376 family)